MKVFKCFSARLAGTLINTGIYPIDREPNLKKPWFVVYIFEDTDELR